MVKDSVKKVITDIDVKRKAIKLVIVHLKKKVPNEFMGMEHFNEWVIAMEELLQKQEFVLLEHIQMRKNLNDVIERVLDENIRFKLRDSWVSLGKAIDKKVSKK